MTSGGFLWSKRGSFEYLTCQALSARGIEHGFIGTSADFSIRGLAKYLPAFKEHFAVSELVLLDQVHGDEVVLYKEGQRNLVGDSILVPRSSVAAGKRVAFGIRVADCLPLLYLSSHGVCLVHAG